MNSVSACFRRVAHPAMRSSATISVPTSSMVKGNAGQVRSRVGNKMRFHSERRFSPSSRVTSPGSVVSMSQIRPRRGPQPKDPGKPRVIHQIAVAQIAQSGPVGNDHVRDPRAGSNPGFIIGPRQYRGPLPSGNAGIITRHPNHTNLNLCVNIRTPSPPPAKAEMTAFYNLPAPIHA